MLYAFRIHSEMTGSSFWFLNEDKEYLKSQIPMLKKYIKNLLEVSNHEDLYMKANYNLEQYCISNQIIYDWDNNTDSMISLENNIYYYGEEEINIIDTWSFRF